MEIIFLPDADDDLQYWVSTGNKAIIKKIAQLVEDIKLHPYAGIGKPEPLKHNLTGAWSRGSIENIDLSMRSMMISY
jgi:toxin YoeB